MERLRRRVCQAPKKSGNSPNPHIPLAKIILKSWRGEHTQLDKLDLGIDKRRSQTNPGETSGPDRLDFS
jgi:hypothetical protein